MERLYNTIAFPRNAGVYYVISLYGLFGSHHVAAPERVHPPDRGSMGPRLRGPVGRSAGQFDSLYDDAEIVV